MPVFRNGKAFSAAQFQWAPTLTQHDPAPPITINSPASAPSSVVARLVAMFRMRRV